MVMLLYISYILISRTCSNVIVRSIDTKTLLVCSVCFLHNSMEDM